MAIAALHEGTQRLKHDELVHTVDKLGPAVQQKISYKVSESALAAGGEMQRYMKAVAAQTR
jgi:hypothetical protein